MKRRADGRWVKKITLPDGTPKYFYSIADTEKKAIKDIEMQLLEYKEEDVNKNLFSNVSQKWADDSFERLEHNTLKQYKPCLKACIDYFKGKMIQDITPVNVKHYIAMLEKNGYAKKTIKNRLSVLNLIMHSALVEQLIVSNPCQFVSIKTPNTREKRQAICAKDIAAIKEHADCTFGFFALFLLYTGLRRGEAFAITPKDIDYKNKTVSITKTVEWIGCKPNIKNRPKTVAGNRIVPLPGFLMPELIKRKNNKYIFQNSKGELMDNSQVTRNWNAYIKESGVKATPHMLRHTYATLLFDADIDVKTAQTWLGHTDIKTTLDIYTHLSEQRRESATEKWQAFLTTF